jgi:two-component system chemotaxis response regulator CheY
MGKKVLVVDDSSFTRKRIIQILEQGGHKVVGEAKSGAEAIDAYKKNKPDIVTMDVTMRGKDGITAAKEILSLDSEAHIIFVTMLEDDQCRDNIQKLGAVGYVNKKNYRDMLDLIDKIG